MNLFVVENVWETHYDQSLRMYRFAAFLRHHLQFWIRGLGFTQKKRKNQPKSINTDHKHVFQETRVEHWLWQKCLDI